MAGSEGGVLALFGVALFAATVNGALGYGFSSLTVPLALLFFPNRILSPALVLVELAINSWMVVMNRGSLAAARGRAIPIIVGLIPGILIGSYLLTRANPGVLKFWTYVVLLPLILSQAAKLIIFAAVWTPLYATERGGAPERAPARRSASRNGPSVPTGFALVRKFAAQLLPRNSVLRVEEVGDEDQS